MDGSVARRPRGGGALGLVGKSVHHRVGHVSQAGGRLGGRSRRDGRGTGAMGILKLTGYILERTGSYTVLFLIAGSAYLIALATLHLLVPRLERAEV